MRNLILFTVLAATLSSTAEAARRYRVYIKTTPPGASVYVSSKESGIRGTTPAKLYLSKGKQTVILELPGYETATKVIQVRRTRRKQNFTFPLVKKVEQSTILISLGSGDSAGTSVTVDGKGHGALPAKVTVKPGRHMVEVTKTGFQTFRQWVDVKPGESRPVTVNLVQIKAKTGTLLVSSTTPGAEIFVDGKTVGKSPALVQNLTVGIHSVEVRAAGHASASKTVTVEADKTVRLAVNLKATKKKPVGGTVHVLADPAGADVVVDGKPSGKAPVKVSELAEGTHYVEGKLAGYVTAGQQVKVTAGQVTTIKLTLKKEEKKPEPVKKAVAGTVVIAGAPTGALASLDGKPAAPLMATGYELKPGSHTVTITAAGHDPLTRTFTVEAGTKLRLEVKMVATAKAPGKDGTPASSPASQPTDGAEEAEVDTRGLSSFGAQLVPPKYFTADISAGFPYLGEGRLTTGVFSKGHLGLDAGVELRTNGALTVIGAIAKFRFLNFNPLSLAAFTGIGGGGGPSGRDAFYFNAGLLVSLSFKGMLTFTGRLYANVYSDRLCPSSADDDELDVCNVIPGTTGLEQDPRERFTGARFFLSAVLEVPITRNVGIFAIVEGAPGQDQRPAFTNAFFMLMPESDPRFYGRAGISFKF